MQLFVATLFVPIYCRAFNVSTHSVYRKSSESECVRDRKRRSVRMGAGASIARTGSQFFSRRLRVLGSLVGLALLACVLPSAASAAECSDTWSGPAEGAWTTAANWSAKHVPNEADVACIGSGKTVNVTTGTNQVGVVQGEGTLTITVGTLEVLNTSEASTIKALTMKSSGTLSGPGTVRVSGTLTWAEESTMAGSGSTVLLSEASASTTLSLHAKIKQRRFVNESTFTNTSGGLVLSEGAEFLNKGTYTTKSSLATIIEKGTGTASFVNTGTFQKTAGTGTSTIGASFENNGTVDAQTGKLSFTGGGSSNSSGKWEAAKGAGNSLAGGSFTLAGTLSGSMAFTGATTAVTLESPNVSALELELEISLNIPSGSTTLASLAMNSSAAITGPGTLNISGTFTWAKETTMSGTGSTVLLSGGTGSTTLTGSAKLEQRQFVNEGTFTTSSGTLSASSGATFVNAGTLQKTTGAGTIEVQIPVENKGTINAQSGTLAFKRGGSSSSSGQWEGTKGGVLGFAGGTFNLANTTLLGSLALNGATTVLNTEGVNSKSGELEVESATLSVSGAATTLYGLTMKSGGIVTGSGILNISSKLTWAKESSMTGSGTTVVLPGASVSTSLTGSAGIKQRQFVNEGTFSQTSGSIAESEGAKFVNSGTFTANTTAATAVSTGTGGSSFRNTGTFQKTAGTGATAVGPVWENEGTVKAQNGSLVFKGGGESSSGSWIASEGSAITFEGIFVFSGGSLSGAISISGFSTSVFFSGVSGTSANLTVSGSTLSQSSGTTTVEGLTVKSSTTITGAGSLRVSKTFTWAEESTMSGTGSTVLLPGATGSTTLSGSARIKQRLLVNEGTFTNSNGTVAESEGAQIVNAGTFNANTTKAISISSGTGGSSFINTGLFQRTSSGETTVEPDFENQGVIREPSGHLAILHPKSVKKSELFGKRCHSGDPVECATGNFSESETDFAIGGRGVGLDLTRVYSAQAAAAAPSAGAYGYGWTGSFSDHLTVEGGGAAVTLTQSDGSTAPFTRVSGTTYSGPSWSQETLSGSPEAGYTFTRADQVQLHFSGTGTLESVVDRNGNETTLSYDEAGRLKTITDPAGRQITLTYNGGGQVESAKDPMGHVVKYAYEGGNVTSVTMPGEEGPRWQFKYDGSHRITSITNGRGGKTTNEYDASGRVISQTDPASRTLTFKYEPFHTMVTNKATGAVTDEWFTSNNEPFSITHGYGTASATTETFSYTTAGQLSAVTDGNGHTTTYGYDVHGNRTSEKDAAGETKWTYSETHDVISTTTPRGETTTIKRDARGNVESVSRPGPEETTETTSFVYDKYGQLESATDPLKRTWTYGYDAQGDRTSEADPLGDTQTLGYDKDSRLISIITPRGNVEGAKPAEYETTVERDQQGRPLKATDVLGHTTEYAYDENGNLKSKTDANGHTTKYVYNADDERTKVEKPNGAILETGYDGAGEVTSQTDARKHATTYVRNVLEEPIEVIDPLGRKTKEEFDAAGNLKSITDPAERKTSYTFDADNRLTKVSYSDGMMPTSEFGYNADGNVTSMVDGTGESSFEYDQLGRLTRAEDGHGDVVGYGYDLAEEMTGIAYPNGKSISRAFDGAGRLESVTDWLGGTTTFSYDADSNLEDITFPAGTSNVDKYSYDQADRMSGAVFKKGAAILALLSYGRDTLGQIKAEARTGLPGPEELSYGYDENNRLVKAGAGSFEYDQADNLTKGLGSTNAYDAASQLETGTGVSYSFDKLGERIKTTPGTGPATAYKYDQAGSLISIERAEEGEVPAINESLAYDGSGLMASKTTGLATHYLTWDSRAALPLLLDDGQNSYIYGPGDVPLEQISEEAPTYLHHDQLGSTRMLTDVEGETSATFSYAPYGGLEGQTGPATTPLRFAGQYTDAATGFQYLRARFYDPATAQFLTKDSFVALTRAPYSYGEDNPLRFIDPSGLACVESFGPLGVYPNIIDCYKELAEETARSPLTSPAVAVGCLLITECTPLRAAIAALVAATTSNLLSAESEPCFDFLSHEIESLVVLLAGESPGALLDTGAARAGSSSGLTPLGERILHVITGAPGVVLDVVHAVAGG
jgi:RHS repeat-associated protein